MKIIIPKVIVPVDLAGYHPELAGNNLYVWVNPPQAKLRAYSELMLAIQTKDIEAANKALFPQKHAKPKEQTSSLQQALELVHRVLAFKKRQKPHALDQRLLEWFSEMWSQGQPEMGWTVDELRVLEAEDPSFLSWMITQTAKVRSDHAEGKAPLHAQ